MKVVEAEVAFWRVVRGSRAVFDGDWFSRIGVFRASFRRSCLYFPLEEASSLLTDMRVVCGKGAAGSARLCGAVADGILPFAGSGSGCLPDGAIWLRSAASMATAFSGVRRASEVAQLLGGNVRVDVKGRVVDPEVKLQENGQFAASQKAHPIAMESRGAVCPVHALSVSPWLRPC